MVFDNTDAQAVCNLIDADRDNTLGLNPRVDLVREEMRARVRPGNRRAEETVLNWLARQAQRPVDNDFVQLIRQYLRQWPAPVMRGQDDPEDVLELFRGFPFDGAIPPLFLAIRRGFPYVVRWMLDPIGAHALQRMSPNTVWNAHTALDNAMNSLIPFRFSAANGGPGPETQLDMVFLLMAAGADPSANNSVGFVTSSMIVSSPHHLQLIQNRPLLTFAW